MATKINQRDRDTHKPVQDFHLQDFMSYIQSKPSTHLPTKTFLNPRQ